MVLLISDHKSTLFIKTSFCRVLMRLVAFNIFLPPRYNWNIVESGDKHHKPITLNIYFFIFQDFVEIFMSGGIAGFRNPEQESFIRFVLIDWFGLMVFNATFNDISVKSWRSVLLVEETRVPVTDKLYHGLY